MFCPNKIWADSKVLEIVALKHPRKIVGVELVEPRWVGEVPIHQRTQWPRYWKKKVHASIFMIANNCLLVFQHIYLKFEAKSWFLKGWNQFKLFQSQCQTWYMCHLCLIDAKIKRLNFKHCLTLNTKLIVLILTFNMLHCSWNALAYCEETQK